MTGTERIRPTAADELTYVVDPEAVCPPSSGGRAAPVEWSDTIPVVVERTCLGVRADSDELGASLREALAPYVRDDLERRPQANLSVVVADDRGHRRGAGFHFLRRGTTAVVRSRDPRRVLAGLASYLSAATEPPDGVVRVNAVALVRDGTATVVPAQMLQWLAQLERRLATNGLEFVDQPWVYLDAGARRDRRAPAAGRARDRGRRPHRRIGGGPAPRSRGGAGALPAAAPGRTSARFRTDRRVAPRWWRRRSAAVRTQAGHRPLRCWTPSRRS